MDLHLPGSSDVFATGIRVETASCPERGHSRMSGSSIAVREVASDRLVLRERVRG